jgi:uncharacterized membrane protein
MDPLLKITFAIIGLGIINTIYLSYHVIKGTPVYCLFLPPEWCEKVQHSKYSKTFGIPNPYLGLGMLSVILVLLLLYSQGTLSLVPAMGLISFGFLFSLYFLYIQLFIIRAFCTWCVVSAIIFSALFILQFYI